MTEQMVDVGGVRLWTTQQGNGLPLLLCNGGPGACDYLAPVADMVDDVCHAIRWEQRGCGRSDATLPYDLATCLSDMEALRVHFGYDRWLVGGHSWGADLSLAYALAHPTRTLGLIHLCGTGVQHDIGWKAAYEQGKGTEQQPDFAYPGNAEVNRVGVDSWRQFIKRPTLLREIAQLHVPALVMAAGQDIRPAWPLAQIANLLPDARYGVIEGASHYIWLTHTDVMRSELRRFLHDRFYATGKQHD